MDAADRSHLHPDPPLIPPSERLIFRGDTAAIGAVRCAPSDIHFRCCGPAREYSFVFPRGAVLVRRPGEPAFIEDASVIAFYNRGQEYERFEIGASGDRCDWFGLAESVVREMVRSFDPRAADDPVRPLRFSHVHGPAPLFLEQRQFFDSVRRGATDPAFVEEAIISLLDAVLSQAYRNTMPAAVTTQATAIAESARGVVARRFAEPLTLARVAGATGVSVFTLCRAFKAAYGVTLHAHLCDIRLRHAIERMEARDTDLGAVALACGFGSQSHFTARFRRTYGCVPSRARAALLLQKKPLQT